MIAGAAAGDGRPALLHPRWQSPGLLLLAEWLENPRQAALKLLPYTGEEPADTYLIQVQLAAQISAWTVEEVAGHAALSWEGKALQLLTNLRPETIQRRFGHCAHNDNAREACRRSLPSRPSSGASSRNI